MNLEAEIDQLITEYLRARCTLVCCNDCANRYTCKCPCHYVECDSEEAEKILPSEY